MIDRLIRRFDATLDADLMLCEHRGVAYQHGPNRIQYDAAYLTAKLDGYDGTDIAKAVNAGRVSMLARWLPGWNEDRKQRSSTVLDYGAGSGAFVRDAIAAGYPAKGFDVIVPAVQRLQRADLYADNPANFDAVTMWDTLEHLEQPERSVFRRMPRGSYLFVSLPIFEDLKRIRESKHYRPGEHLYYWTAEGLRSWMELYGFRMVESSNHETESGRENIGAFAFCRDLPDYHDYIAAYREIHSVRHYGSSATELHLTDIAAIVRAVKPKSILDYGCGRGDLVAHFWLDGAREIARYDPAIPTWKSMPERKFEMILCCDVLEHVPMTGLDRVFIELQELLEPGGAVIFTISTKLARAKLPDGRNAHCTLLRSTEWARWLKDVFGKVECLPTKWEHE